MRCLSPLDARLAAAEKRGVGWGRESASEHVGESAGGEAGAEIAADIEARPTVGGSGRRRWRCGCRWRRITRQRSGPITKLNAIILSASTDTIRFIKTSLSTLDAVRHLIRRRAP